MTDDTANFEQTLDNLVALARYMEAYPNNVRKRLKELETIYQLLTYYSTPNLRQEWTPPAAKADEIVARRCSVEGCQGGPKLWNVARPNKPDNWRCLQHIPKDITFPISLWGEDWKAVKKEEK